MLRLFGESDNLSFDGWTIPRPDALDLTVVERRVRQPFPQYIASFRICVHDIAVALFKRRLHAGEIREDMPNSVTGLRHSFRKIDSAPVQTHRCSRLHSVGSETQVSQLLGQPCRNRLGNSASGERHAPYCDIAVENVIDRLNRASVKRPLTYVRQNAYQQITAEEKVVAAAPAYRWLTRQTPGVLRQLEREFVADDHRLWPKDAPEQPQQMPTPLPQKTWQKIGERMQTELDLRDKEAGEGADALKQQVKAANRSRRSYKDFLRRFCVMREEVKLDPDEFDLNFYTYGLSVYGNLPLIEPLETRESKKIEELALVIDTSYSTSGALVRAFLAETYTLLKGQENFFHRMNLHLIQADNAIRQDLLIRNEDELIHAMNHFELRGGGGTDFRPAFAYVDRLCAEKKFSNLRGLLYFTDGMGTYPAKRPAYDTAFLFLGERFDDANVPPWAMKVVLDEEEFTGAAARPASALADALAEEDDLYRDLNNS